MGGRNGQQGRVIQQTAPHQGAAHLPRPRALGPTPPAWPATATFVAVRLSGSPAAHGALSSGKKPPRLPPSITAPGVSRRRHGKRNSRRAVRRRTTPSAS
jgi:hypothetical protein